MCLNLVYFFKAKLLQRRFDFAVLKSALFGKLMQDEYDLM